MCLPLGASGADCDKKSISHYLCKPLVESRSWRDRNLKFGSNYPPPDHNLSRSQFHIICASHSHLHDTNLFFSVDKELVIRVVLQERSARCGSVADFHCFSLCSGIVQHNIACRGNSMRKQRTSSKITVFLHEINLFGLGVERHVGHILGGVVRPHLKKVLEYRL